MFSQEARALGVELGQGCIFRFARYLEELQHWNCTVRLVSRAEAQQVLWLHFLDSLALVCLLEGEGPLLDVGSGAGFPGIPVKLARPEMEVHLVEARRRKANFLRHMVRALSLEGVWVHQGRVGRGGLELGGFPLVVARAVAEPLVWLQLAQGLVARDGSLFLMLGHRQETKELRLSLRQLGWDLAQRRDYVLPVVERRRSILVLKRS